jgi:hypothetical protein
VQRYTWLYWTLSAVAGVGLGGLVMTQTNWWKVRKYAIDIKRVFDKYKLQEKAEALQTLGQNPNPVLAKKPLRDIIDTYKGLITDMEKIKVPKKMAEIHADTLEMHKESMGLYQMAMVGGFRQKSMVDKQKKLQQMERNLQEKMEKVYGKPKEPKAK